MSGTSDAVPLVLVLEKSDILSRNDGVEKWYISPICLFRTSGSHLIVKMGWMDWPYPDNLGHVQVCRLLWKEIEVQSSSFHSISNKIYEHSTLIENRRLQSNSRISFKLFISNSHICLCTFRTTREGINFNLQVIKKYLVGHIMNSPMLK